MTNLEENKFEPEERKSSGSNNLYDSVRHSLDEQTGILQQDQSEEQPILISNRQQDNRSLMLTINNGID